MAQIQMESLDLKTPQTNSRDTILFAKRGSQNVIINTFERESSIFKVPQLDSSTLVYSRTLLKSFVQIDSSLYNLNNKAYFRLNRDWVCSTSVLKKSEAEEIYGYKGEDGIVIFRLYSKYEDDFLNGAIATYPSKIKQVN